MRYQKFKKPTKKDADFYWFCGVIVGDGSISTGQLSLSTVDKEFHDKFKKVGIKLSKVIPTQRIIFFENPNKSDMYRCTFNNKNMCDYFRGIFNDKHYSKNWEIPNFVKSASKREKCALIKGFFDSEGCISEDGLDITCSSINKKGLSQISELYHEVGVTHKLFDKKKIYIIKITSNPENRLRFKTQVGCTIKRKMKRLLNRINADNPRKRKCKLCKNRFQPSINGRGKYTQYCSLKCKNKVNGAKSNKKLKIMRRFRRKQIKKICGYCGKTFKPYTLVISYTGIR